MLVRGGSSNVCLHARADDDVDVLAFRHDELAVLHACTECHDCTGRSAVREGVVVIRAGHRALATTTGCSKSERSRLTFLVEFETVHGGRVRPGGGEVQTVDVNRLALSVHLHAEDGLTESSTKELAAAKRRGVQSEEQVSPGSLGSSAASGPS